MNEKKMGKSSLSERLKNPEFLKLLEREEFIESFLDMVEEEMESQGVSQRKLAKRLGCGPANLSRILRRERNMTANTMVDIAFHLGLRIRLTKQRVHDYAALWSNPSIQYPWINTWYTENALKHYVGHFMEGAAPGKFMVADRYPKKGGTRKECSERYSSRKGNLLEQKAPKSYRVGEQVDSKAKRELVAA